MEGSEEAYNVPAVAYVLQSKMSTVAERITALRSLKSHLDGNKSMDAFSKKRIKQIILDSVLQLILSEEKVTNVVKRQMVRTELFLILANLLDSNVLFGSIFGADGGTVPVEDDADGDLDRSTEEPVHNGSRIMKPPGGWVKRKLTKGHVRLRGGEKHSSSSTSLLSQSLSSAQIPSIDDFSNPPEGRPERTGSSYSSISGLRRRTASQSATDLTLLKPLMRQHARNQHTSTALSSLSSKTWKPRPSILHSELVADGFVPGVDPMNYFEQDRKLGYQKPRMWFPGALISAQTDLIPTERRAQPSQGGSEQVVREFLQMRSLASYVGDLVTPFTPAGPRQSYLSGNVAGGKQAPGTAQSGILT